jgi:hypothetical protein
MPQLLPQRGIVDRSSNKDKSALRIGYADCWLPCPPWGTCDPGRVVSTDPKQDMATADERSCGPAKELF